MSITNYHAEIVGSILEYENSKQVKQWFYLRLENLYDILIIFSYLAANSRKKELILLQF